MMKAIFLDWDDTLNVHNEFKRCGEEAAMRVVEADLLGRGTKTDRERVHRAYKSAEIMMFSRKEFDRIRIWKAALGKLGLELDDKVVRRAVEQYWRTIEANSHLAKDAVYVLGELRRRGYRLGIIADYDDHIRDKRGVIERSPIGSLFDVIVLGGADHPTTKPDPSIFSYACEKIGCKPSEAIMVGDSSDDSVGAERAGLTSVIIQQDKIRVGHYSIKDLMELLNVLDRINSR